MSKSNVFKSIISGLIWDGEDFVANYEECLAFIESVVQNSEELQEETHFVDLICQVCVIDLRYNFWLEVSNGKFIYHRGVSNYPELKFVLPNEILLAIFKQNLTVTEVYMKGLIKIQGTLKNLIYIRNFLNNLFNYLQKV